MPLGFPMSWLIGTSGWSYNHWRGVFYPEDLRSKDWLRFYSRNFCTVEVNSTFYHMPQGKTLDRWREVSPENFVFTLKMNRLVTHRKKLRDVDALLERFLAEASRLGDKLGVILHQLPPSMKKDIPLLASFLRLLPKKMKHAVEFRHESWSVGETFDLLSSEGIAYCVVSSPDLKAHVRATAPFAYIRMHGTGGWYASCYTDPELNDWANHIVKLAKERQDGYVYFNNDYAGYAVQNALALRENLRHPSRRGVLSVA
jgi:uncharacterized protein YecE (DUF72 family)